MPQVTQGEPVERLKRHQLAPIVSAAAVAAIAIGWAGWYFLAPPSVNTVVSRADALDNSGNYAAAGTLLKNAYGRAITTSNEALIVSRQAATSADMGDNGAALRYYQQLNRLSPNNYSTLLSMGDLADRTGDKQLAASAYSQALGIVKAGPPTIGSQSKIDSLTAAIAGLQR